jgi:hypothetical protein
MAGEPVGRTSGPTTSILASLIQTSPPTSAKQDAKENAGGVLWHIEHYVVFLPVTCALDRSVLHIVKRDQVRSFLDPHPESSPLRVGGLYHGAKALLERGRGLEKLLESNLASRNHGVFEKLGVVVIRKIGTIMCAAAFLAGQR